LLASKTCSKTQSSAIRNHYSRPLQRTFELNVVVRHYQRMGVGAGEYRWLRGSDFKQPFHPSRQLLRRPAANSHAEERPGLAIRGGTPLRLRGFLFTHSR
jgi:hypothetical protein